MKRFLLPILMSGLVLALSVSDALKSQDPIKKAPMKESLGKMPLFFEVNRGQTDSQVKFLSRGGGHSLFLTPTESVLSLSRLHGRHAVLRMSLVGANTTPQMRGVEELQSKSNYLIGNDPKKWRTGVPNYGKVKYEAVYPGIDLVYYGNQGQLEYDLVVAPGADPKSVTLDFQGAERIEVDENGALVLHLPGGEVIQHRPIVYQEAKGTRKTIPGSYVLKGKDQVGFRVATYDASEPLVIDPILSYATYLGGSEGAGEFPYYYNNVAFDASGAAYVASLTDATDFPAMNEFQADPGDAKTDVTVTKLDPSQSGGAQLIYSTYLGGNDEDTSSGIAVDSAGNVYVTGWTQSTDFPTKNAYQGNLASGGFDDAFLAKLDPSQSGAASLVYSTYLGGGALDEGLGMDVDDAGVAYLTGQTYSTDLPTRNAFNAAGDAPDAFVAKIDTSLSGDASLLYATYLGGTMDASAYEQGQDIAVDAAGHIYVTGVTAAKDFPVKNAFQPSKGDPTAFNAFVTELDPSQSGAAQLLYSTYLGGAKDERGYGIEVDPAGKVYVTGVTSSTGFPTRNAFQDTLKGTDDAFIAEFDPTQSGDPSLLYSTYLGGDGGDFGYSIALDPLGKVYVTGGNDSTDFPIRNAFQTSKKGPDDAFIAQFDLSQTGDASLLFSTNLGGDNYEEGDGIAVDSSCVIYVAGTTNSGNFPTVSPFQNALKGTYDNFVAKIAPDAPPVITSDLAASGTIAQAFSYTIVATGATPMTLETANLPDGLVFDGTSITGTPTAAGTTSVTLTATNSDCIDIQALVITIAPAPSGGTTGGTTGGTVGTDGGSGGCSLIRD